MGDEERLCTLWEVFLEIYVKYPCPYRIPVGWERGEHAL